MKPLTKLSLLLLIVLASSYARPEDDSDEGSSSDEHGQFLGAKRTNCSCGWTNKSNGRIMGGKKTEVNEYPYMAMLLIIIVHEYYANSRCGAGILTTRHALTAAHCVKSEDPYLQYDQFFLLVGDRETRFKDRSSPSSAMYRVERFIKHPDYKAWGWKNDIAIVVTDRAMEMGPTVGPVCLPTGSMHQFLVENNSTLRLAGWGKTSIDDRPSGVLLKINFKVAPLEVCHQAFPSTKINLDVRSQICAQHSTKGLCMGDSGGPLVWLDPETNRYTAVALVSFTDVFCKLGKPSTHTDIGYYMPWIQKTISDTGLGLQTCAKE